MEDRVRTMSCNLSNRYLNPGFKELRSTIADHQAPSWGQMYFLVELCKKQLKNWRKILRKKRSITAAIFFAPADQKTF